MRNRLAGWMIRAILRTIASRQMYRIWHEAMLGWLENEALREAVELVLLNHVWEIDQPPGQQDPDLAELAHVYQRLTGFDPIKEASRGR